MKKILVLCFIFCSVIILRAQNTPAIDSLINLAESEKTDTVKVMLLNEISQEYLKTDFNKAFEYAEKALSEAKKIKNEKSIALSYTYMAYAQYRLNKFDDAKVNINKALTIYELLENQQYISSCYSFISQLHYAQQEYPEAVEWVKKSIRLKLDNNQTKELEINYLTLGAIYEKQGKYELALKNLFKAVEYYDKNGNEKGKASAYNNIAIVYRKNGNLKLAQEYYEKSLALHKSNNNKFGELKIYNNLAVLYEKQGMKDKAISYYNKVIKLSKEVDFMGGIAMSQINIAGLYIESGKNLDEAERLLDDSEKICINTRDRYKLPTVYGLKGQLFEKRNNLPKAVYFSKKAYDITLEIKDAKNTFELASQLAEFYKKLKDYKNALKYYEIYAVTKDSVFNIEKTSVIEEMKARFETESKEKELKIKTAKIELLEKEQEINSIKSRLSLFGKIAIFVFIILMIFYYKRKLKRQKELAEKNRKFAENEKRMLELDMKNQEFEKKQLETELQFKDRELQNFAFHIVDKNDFIGRLKNELLKIQKNTDAGDFKNELRNVLFFINDKMTQERDREEFMANVEQIYSQFSIRLSQKFPELSENDKRLASLLRMGLQSKEIAAILHITPKSVDTNRYRLRKKMNLSSDVNLNDFINKI